MLGSLEFLGNRWHSLPDDIINAGKLSRFKRDLNIHLNAHKRKHPSYNKELTELRKVVKEKRKAVCQLDDLNQPGQEARKQLCLTDLSGDGRFNFRKEASKAAIEEALLDWMVDSIQPFREVERPSFIKLWEMCNPKHKLMCKKTLQKRIGEKFEAMKAKLIEKMAMASYVGTTADCWTVFQRSYLGITAHWLDPQTLQRQSAALSCRRLKTAHTHNLLATEMSSVFVEYMIQNKLSNTVTDNGANFVKAFRIFGPSTQDEDEEESDTVPMDIINVGDILSSNEESEIVLPPHQRCASHTLNLIATTDAENATKSDFNYRKISRSSFAKCQALWNKQHRSGPCADSIRENLGVCLVVPNITRWNSLYRAVNFLNRHLRDKEEKIHLICDAAGLNRFSKIEIDFLKEYSEVVSPLASALDILQGEKKISIGFLLPTLHHLLDILQKMLVPVEQGNRNPLKYCKPLVEVFVDSIKRRFKDALWDKELVLAASTHPRFKLDWVEATKTAEARIWLMEVAEELRPEASFPAITDPTVEEDDYGGFFTFKKNKENQESGKEEMSRYLKQPTSSAIKESLEGFPVTKQLFIRYNTSLPSSAAVERLFSCGGEVFSNKRARLGDKNFEIQLLLKVNNQL